MRALVEVIRSETISRGVLSFVRFMELALYCPVYGYYETKKDNPGRRGDFFTSVNVGELFGRLLAFQFAEWLNRLRIADCGLRIVEAGAHDGTLARDILTWLQNCYPKLSEQIEYFIIEPSSHRREWQEEKLGKLSLRLRWFSDFEDLKFKTRNSKLTGIVFSNELLDAMPVRRLGWDAVAKKWFEWGVAIEGEKFIWAKIPNADLPSSILDLPSSLLTVLPDGYTVEVSPAAENWWREAAGFLGQGKLVTIDYGMTADELFSPNRPHGTLRAYFRHHVTDDLLANVGQQDITSHVNFSTIQAVGESLGLKTESFCSQTQFLTRLLGKALKGKPFDGWNASCARQFQTLTHPEHLGRAFRVLVQSR